MSDGTGLNISSVDAYRIELPTMITLAMSGCGLFFISACAVCLIRCTQWQKKTPYTWTCVDTLSLSIGILSLSISLILWALSHRTTAWVDPPRKPLSNAPIPLANQSVPRTPPVESNSPLPHTPSQVLPLEPPQINTLPGDKTASRKTLSDPLPVPPPFPSLDDLSEPPMSDAVAAQEKALKEAEEKGKPTPPLGNPPEPLQSNSASPSKEIAQLPLETISPAITEALRLLREEVDELMAAIQGRLEVSLQSKMTVIQNELTPLHQRLSKLEQERDSQGDMCSPLSASHNRDTLSPTLKENTITPLSEGAEGDVITIDEFVSLRRLVYGLAGCIERLKRTLHTLTSLPGSSSSSGEASVDDPETTLFAQLEKVKKTCQKTQASVSSDRGAIEDTHASILKLDAALPGKIRKEKEALLRIIDTAKKTIEEDTFKTLAVGAQVQGMVDTLTKRCELLFRTTAAMQKEVSRDLSTMRQQLEQLEQKLSTQSREQPVSQLHPTPPSSPQSPSPEGKYSPSSPRSPSLQPAQTQFFQHIQEAVTQGSLSENMSNTTTIDSRLLNQIEEDARSYDPNFESDNRGTTKAEQSINRLTHVIQTFLPGQTLKNVILNIKSLSPDVQSRHNTLEESDESDLGPA